MTGSGRLDLYQKGGDSLAGRYLLFSLWPFTLCELGGFGCSLDDFLADPLFVEQTEGLDAVWERLETLSGFPEPFLSGKAASYRRWSLNYGQRLVREDIRELSDIRSIGAMETLYHLLPSRTGSPLSITSLAGDLKVAYNSVQSWLALFERFFLTFSLTTWTDRIARAIQKERKVYLFDAPRIKDPSARFENMVAVELWRAINCWNARGDGEFTMHFVRDAKKREVNFLIANERRPFYWWNANSPTTVPRRVFCPSRKSWRYRPYNSRAPAPAFAGIKTARFLVFSRLQANGARDFRYSLRRTPPTKRQIDRTARIERAYVHLASSEASS